MYFIVVIGIFWLIWFLFILIYLKFKRQILPKDITLDEGKYITVCLLKKKYRVWAWKI